MSLTSSQVMTTSLVQGQPLWSSILESHIITLLFLYDSHDRYFTSLCCYGGLGFVSPIFYVKASAPDITIFENRAITWVIKVK